MAPGDLGQHSECQEEGVQEEDRGCERTEASLWTFKAPLWTLLLQEDLLGYLHYTSSGSKTGSNILRLSWALPFPAIKHINTRERRKMRPRRKLLYEDSGDGKSEALGDLEADVGTDCITKTSGAVLSLDMRPGCLSHQLLSVVESTTFASCLEQLNTRLAVAEKWQNVYRLDG
ncbi:hypothetical protein MJT46_012465 [Ovis ammon polii x Ovis aries]|nr:hypothetical protein MJT46_012465 [Ovis ammon polii x Ovis aries]